MKPRVACINAPLPTRPTLPPTTSSPAANLSPNWALLFHNVCYRTCHPSGIFCARLVMGRFHDPVMTSRAAPIVLFARRRSRPSVETTKQPCTWERKKATVIGISLLHVSVLLKAFPSTLRELRCAFRRSYDIAVPLGFGVSPSDDTSIKQVTENIRFVADFRRTEVFIFCFIIIRVDASVSKYCFSAASIRTYSDDTQPCLLWSSWHVLSIPFSCLYLSYARGLQLRHSML